MAGPRRFYSAIWLASMRPTGMDLPPQLPAALPTATTLRARPRGLTMRRREPTKNTGRSSMRIRFRCLSCRWTVPRPGIKTYNAARKELRLDESLYDTEEIGAKHGCTLFVTLLAGFEALLSRLSGQEDFVVGVPMAGQTLLENSHLVGHCVNLIPLRCRIDPDGSLRRHLKSVRHDVPGRPVAPAGHIREPGAQLQCPTDPARRRWFPSLSISTSRCAIRISVISRSNRLKSAQALRQLRDSINVVDTVGIYVVECDYNTDLFASATIERWLGHYRVLLQAVVENPEQRIGNLAPLTEAERQQFLLDWNGTAAEYPAGALMHQLFEAQVERAPGARQ